MLQPHTAVVLDTFITSSNKSVFGQIQIGGVGPYLTGTEQEIGLESGLGDQTWIWRERLSNQTTFVWRNKKGPYQLQRPATIFMEIVRWFKQAHGDCLLVSPYCNSYSFCQTYYQMLILLCSALMPLVQLSSVLWANVDFAVSWWFKSLNQLRAAIAAQCRVHIRWHIGDVTSGFIL